MRTGGNAWPAGTRQVQSAKISCDAAIPDSCRHQVHSGGLGHGWVGMVVIAFLNAVLRRGYEGALGELRAHQVSSVVLLLLLAPWVRWVERRHPLPTGRAATQVGLSWAAATMAFEFGFGRYVNGDSWATLLNAYDLRQGQTVALRRGRHRLCPGTGSSLATP